MRAVLVASGEPDPADVRWVGGADLVLAVDAGASWLAEIGRRPDALVGDLDSVDPRLVAGLEADGVTVERYPTEKDASDTELAVGYALRRGATEVVLIGGFGGDRLDHGLANLLLLLAAPRSEWPRARLTAVKGGTQVRAIRDGESLVLDAPPGTLVSLLPVGGDAEGLVTSGLRYPLDDESLAQGSTRGLSNEVVAAPASVRLRRGALLVIETAREGAPE
jgi:thiamine pyrophosphokinase